MSVDTFIDMFDRHVQLVFQPLITFQNKFVAGCLGDATRTYEQLLSNLRESQCKLKNFKVDPGSPIMTIHYEVEGTREEVANFRRLLGKK
jgi:hypothetical protein